MEPQEEQPARSKRGKKQGPDRHRPGWLAELLDWTKTLAVAIVIVLLLHFFVFNLSTVKGFSMEPTLEEREWLYVNKAVYFLGKPGLGDVIVLNDPSTGPEHKQFLVKRIVGVPGDTIEIRNAQLYRNGELVVESYTDSEIEGTDLGPFVVESEKYFVMGDNRKRGASRDSRNFGTASIDNVKGRADLVLWPITKLNWL
jgi:signal peptidase I